MVWEPLGAVRRRDICAQVPGPGAASCRPHGLLSVTEALACLKLQQLLLPVWDNVLQLTPLKFTARRFSWHLLYYTAEHPHPLPCCALKIPTPLLKASTGLRNFLLRFSGWAYVTDEIKNTLHYKVYGVPASAVYVELEEYFNPQSLTWFLAHCPDLCIHVP